ncbi:hypothetical protein PENSPDRAFT_747599, partial [Peniophora sp. CONT]
MHLIRRSGGHVRGLIHASIVPNMDLLDLIYDVRDSLLSGKYNHSDPLTKRAFTTAFGAMRAAPQAFSALVNGLEAVKTIDPDDSEYARVRATILVEEHADLVAALKGVVEAKSHRLQSTYAAGKSPIFSIPAEILSEVFVLQQCESNCSQSPFVSSVKTLRLVCRRFRDVIDSAAVIWNSVTVTGNKYRTILALQRSKKSPITLRLIPSSPPNAGWSESLSLAFAEFSRVKQLDIDVSKLPTLLSRKNKTIAWNCTRFPPAPSLERLRIRGCAIGRLDIISYFQETVPTLLSSIELEFCSLLPYIVLGLKHLTLKDCTIHGTIHTFMRTLSQMPSMHSLYWRSCSFDGADRNEAWASSTYSSRSINIPLLQSLTLHDTDTHVTALLAPLNLPGDVTISISTDCTSDDSTIDTQSALLAVLEIHFLENVTFGCGFQTITIPDRGFDGRIFSILAESFNAEGGPSSFEFGMLFTDADYTEVYFMLRSLLRIMALPAFHLAASKLCVHRKIHSTIWLPFIQHCTRLETIEMQNADAAWGLGRTFTQWTHMYFMYLGIFNYDDEEGKLVPLLSKIVIREESLSGLRSGRDERDLERLDEALHTRGAAGLCIQQLAIFGCNVTRRDIDMVKNNGYIKKITWDGKIRGMKEREGIDYRRTRASLSSNRQS